MEKCEETPECVVKIGENSVDAELTKLKKKNTLVKMKHPCGCETVKLPDGAISIKPCELHKNHGYVWIAMQHEEK